MVSFKERVRRWVGLGKNKPRKVDLFAETDLAAEARDTLDAVISGIDDDPVLNQVKEWGDDREVFAQKRRGDPMLCVPRNGEARGLLERGVFRAGESLIFGSDLMAAPAGDASAVARYRAELRGVNHYGKSIIGLGSTDLYELTRLVNWMLLHNPFAKNVTRGLNYLTVGQGISVAWPGDRKGSGKGRERTWAEVERMAGFQRQIRRISSQTFGFGEWFVIPQHDKKRGGPTGVPNRLLHIEPDRVTATYVNEADAEDVVGYQIDGTIGKTGKMADDVIHAKIDDHGNVSRGITPLLPAIKYLRFAEMMLESRHYLNLMRSRLPLIRQVKGSTAQLTKEKQRLQKLPPPGTIIVDPESHNWVFPSLQIQSADASDDWLRIVLAIAAAVGVPAHMVANDVSQGTYASTLVTESPTIRMVEDYRHLFVETWISDIVRALSGRDDGFQITFAPVIKRAIGENAQAVSVLVAQNILSRQTGCEFLGYDWEGADGEKERIEAEREMGFGMEAGGGIPGLDLFGLGTELPNTRKPEPTTGAALGAKGSQMPNQSAAGA